jgi:hypothetical protein
MLAEFEALASRLGIARARGGSREWPVGAPGAEAAIACSGGRTRRNPIAVTSSVTTGVAACALLSLRPMFGEHRPSSRAGNPSTGREAGENRFRAEAPPARTQRLLLPARGLSPAALRVARHGAAYERGRRLGASEPPVLGRIAEVESPPGDSGRFPAGMPQQ